MGKAVFFWVMVSVRFSGSFSFANCITWAILSQSLCICADEPRMHNCGELFEHFILAAFLITRTNFCN